MQCSCIHVQLWGSKPAAVLCILLFVFQLRLQVYRPHKAHLFRAIEPVVGYLEIKLIKVSRIASIHSVVRGSTYTIPRRRKVIDILKQYSHIHMKASIYTCISLYRITFPWKPGSRLNLYTHRQNKINECAYQNNACTICLVLLQPHNRPIYPN